MRLCCTATEINRGQALKLVTVIIKPFKLDEVREAVSGLGVTGMTVTEVKGLGRQKGEVACSSDVAPRVVEAIQAAAHTGSIGDGKIFVLDVGQAVRIRTGEIDN